MRVQSLWANLQGSPVALFNLQGGSSERSVREVQSCWRILGFRIGLARSKRDSRTIERISSTVERKKEKRCERRSRSQGSEATNLFSKRNSQTTQCFN